jgi:hypothetical protein
MQIETASRGGYYTLSHFEMPKLNLLATLNIKVTWPCSSQMKALEENLQLLISSDKNLGGLALKYSEKRKVRANIAT